MNVNNVLKPCELPDGVVPLTTKWVYTIKTDANGKIVKCAFGCKGLYAGDGD